MIENELQDNMYEIEDEYVQSTLQSRYDREVEDVGDLQSSPSCGSVDLHYFMYY